MQRAWRETLKPEVAAFMEGKRIFLSINRFERKKVHLATSHTCRSKCHISIGIPFLEGGKRWRCIMV